MVTKKAAGIFISFFTLFALVAVAFPAPSFAGNEHSTQTVTRAMHFMNELPVQTQKISTEVMYVALGIDVEENLGNLQKSRDFFLKVLHALRKGDPELDVLAATNPHILEALGKVEALWPRFDLAVQRVLSAKTAAEEDLITINEYNLPLLKATEEMITTVIKK